MIKDIAEYAFDLQSGLSSLSVAELDDLQVLGIAATLAIHIKGLPQIDYEVLRKVSDYYMGIPSIALEKPLRALSDVNFVRLIENGKRIETVIPNIPVFSDVYANLGQYALSELKFNSHEEALVTILSELRSSPHVKDSLLHRTGIDRPVFDRVMAIGAGGGLLAEHKARGKSVLISPFYFSDNLSGLADAAASAGAGSIQSAIKKVKDNQGWPLSVLTATGEIGGNKLSPTEASLIQKLSEEGILKPPTIKFGMKTESFIFTPKPGEARLNAANKEIYERAMALISATRKGQLLPNEYRIRSPAAILSALRDKGYLGANSEAHEQYHNLVMLRVASLRQVGSMWQLHLNQTPENQAALTLAINMLKTGSMAGMEVNQEARIALTKGETYVQSLISARALKERKRQEVDHEAAHEFEQLIMKFE